MRADDAGVVCCADGVEGVGYYEGFVGACSDVIDWVGVQSGGFAGGGTDDFGDWGDLVVEIAFGVVGEDEFIVD